MISKSLGFLEKQLPHFIRTHKTLLINPDCIKKIQNQLHSKTGGAVILENDLVLPVSRRQWPVLVKSVWDREAAAIETDRSIALVSGDATKSLLLGQLIREHWPSTRLHAYESGAFLSQLLTLTEADQPALLLLDLRQAASSRITLLQELRETPELRRLPVVLLTTATTGIGRTAFTLQANSVVVVPDDNSQFVQVMEQVCRYWLTMPSLPAF